VIYVRCLLIVSLQFFNSVHWKDLYQSWWLQMWKEDANEDLRSLHWSKEDAEVYSKLRRLIKTRLIVGTISEWISVEFGSSSCRTLSWNNDHEIALCWCLSSCYNDNILLWLALLNVFAAIGNAFAVLSDAQKRQRYDEYGSDETEVRRRRHPNGYEYDFSRGFEGEWVCVYYHRSLLCAESSVLLKSEVS